MLFFKWFLLFVLATSFSPVNANILVIGGGGFAGASIRDSNLFPNVTFTSRAPKNNDIEFEYARPSTWNNIESNYEAIILAAPLVPFDYLGKTGDNDSETVKQNQNFALQFMDFLQSSPFTNKSKIIVLSSIGAYAGVGDAKAVHDETSPINPLAKNGRFLVEKEFASIGAIVLRLGGLVSAQNLGMHSKMISRFNGNVKTHWVSAGDLASGLKKLISDKRVWAEFETLNLVNLDAFYYRDYLELLKKLRYNGLTEEDVYLDGAESANLVKRSDFFGKETHNPFFNQLGVQDSEWKKHLNRKR